MTFTRKSFYTGGANTGADSGRSASLDRLPTSTGAGRRTDISRLAARSVKSTSPSSDLRLLIKPLAPRAITGRFNVVNNFTRGNIPSSPKNNLLSSSESIPVTASVPATANSTALGTALGTKKKEVTSSAPPVNKLSANATTQLNIEIQHAANQCKILIDNINSIVINETDSEEKKQQNNTQKRSLFRPLTKYLIVLATLMNK